MFNTSSSSSSSSSCSSCDEGLSNFAALSSLYGFPTAFDHGLCEFGFGDPQIPGILPSPVKVEIEDEQNMVSYGIGSGDVLPAGVVSVQAEARNLEGYKDEKVKQELPVTQQICSPVFPEEVKVNLPFPPNLEPPAIFGGKLPPRATKTRTKKHVYTERELRIRRKKGLPDDSDSESEERRYVRLPRRSLLKITTSQMSDFVKFARQQYHLSPSQKDELSRQKRLVKNRESACRFRAKKVLSLLECNERLAELENDVVALREENERLRRQLELANASGLPISDV